MPPRALPNETAELVDHVVISPEAHFSYAEVDRLRLVEGYS